MKPFDHIFSYIAWHYDSGSKVIWHSSQSFLRFISRACGTHAILRLFPVPQHLGATEGSLPGVLIGIAMHGIALVLRLAAMAVSMAISILALAGSITVFILWMLFPVIVILFVITIAREVVQSI